MVSPERYVRLPQRTGLYNRLVGAINSIHTTRYAPPEAIVMAEALGLGVGGSLHGHPAAGHPGRPQLRLDREWGHPDRSGPGGHPARFAGLCGPSIPTNLGAGTNEDRVFVGRFSDCWLYESELRMEAFNQTYGDQLSVLVLAYGYSAFLPDRYGASVNIVSGTGLVAPTL
jgi:hypothetical protein